MYIVERPIELILILVMISLCVFMFLRTKVIKSNLKKMLSFYEIKPGNKAILPNYSLTYTDNAGKKINFCVTYELEVVEISDDRVKVKVLDISSQSAHGNDPSQRASIIDIVHNNWIKKVNIELITTMSLNEIRDKKLDAILDERF